MPAVINNKQRIAVLALFVILQLSFSSFSNIRPSFACMALQTSEVERLTAELKSGDEEERRTAAIALAAFAGEPATSALAGAVNDASPRVRASVIEALRLRNNEFIGRLISERLRRDKEEFVRKTAAYALAQFTGAERTSALIAALSDKSSEVRGAAVVALADHPDAEALSAVSTALHDTSAFVRAHAVRAIGVNGARASPLVKQLIEILSSDTDSEVKRQAATALGKVGNSAAIPSLERARHSSDPYLAQAAAEALKMIGEASKSN